MNKQQTRKILIGLTILVVLLLSAIPILIHKDDIKDISVPYCITEKKEPMHPVVEEYLDFISSRLDSIHNVGAALTIVTKDKILLQKAFGVKKTGTHDSIDVHTIFRLASVSKGFAGVLACLLEQEGIISLQNRIIDFIPDFRLRDSVNTYNLTIAHLLSHTSGLIPYTFDNLIEDGISFPLILSNLYAVEISAPPGLLYGYQNVLFSLIDTIGCIQSGHNFDELVRKMIFKPLRMRNASTGTEIFTRKNANFAYPHDRCDTAYCVLPLNLRYYNIVPSAGINASISDMGKWLQALLGGYPEILDSSLLDEITSPVIETALKRKYTRYWDKIDSKHYGLGWRIYIYKGRKIVYHGGFVKGYRAEIAFCPEENIGIAFLQNSPNQLASLSIPAFFNSWFHHLSVDSLPDISKNVLFDGIKIFNDSNDYDNY